MYVRVRMPMMQMPKLLMAVRMRRFDRIARLNCPFVKVGVHIQKLFYALGRHRAALPRPYYAV